MKIAVGSDKSGFVLKSPLLEHVRGKGHEADDHGTHQIEKPAPFTRTATSVAKAVASGAADRGILICGTGMGMAITANKTRGAYAAVTESVYAAKMCRWINNANILCLGAFILGETMAKEMVDAFLTTEFTAGMEQWRVDLLAGQLGILKEIEGEHFK
ncbi:MAG: RpiB/LacA/LacB family sugar-phosphate isomerase [Planctomycetota bacterium]|jgi:ribose 5-phosphate isomerase B|nr:RpiB/LacA/LacB family sugar-phosphate isomerase [Planctomycetota bacterium]